jgi:hypothetical protein
MFKTTLCSGILLAAIVVCSAVPLDTNQQEQVVGRSKRDVFDAWELAKILSDYGISAWTQSKLTTHGCWCGWGDDDPPNGDTVDSVDMCCKVHDQCYDNAQDDRNVKRSCDHSLGSCLQSAGATNGWDWKPCPYSWGLSWGQG